MPSLMKVHFDVRGKYVYPEVGSIETMTKEEALGIAGEQFLEHADLGDLEEVIAGPGFEITPVRGKWEVVLDVTGRYSMTMKYDRDPKGLDEKACEKMAEKTFGELQEIEWKLYDPKKEKEEEDMER